MANKKNSKKRKRLKEIEDRKIEILLEISSFNNQYNEKIPKLNSEYAQLHKEYYQLKFEMIRKKE